MSAQMREASRLVARSIFSGWRVVLLGIVLVTLIPVSLVGAEAKRTHIPLTLGESSIPLAPQMDVTTPAISLPMTPIASAISLDAPDVLGAPPTGEMVVRGDCNLGPFCWVGEIFNNVLKPVGAAVIECGKGAVETFLFFNLGGIGRCAAAIGSAMVSAVGWVLSKVITLVMSAFYQDLIDSTEAVIGFVFSSLLGDSPVLAAHLNCKFAVVSADCASEWFSNQVALMWLIGQWIIIPLLILVAIQSIIKGSLFFLLRAFLIMLPAAILGGIVMTVVGQMLLDIVDEFCKFLVRNTIGESLSPDQRATASSSQLIAAENWDKFQKQFTDALNVLRDQTAGLASAGWLILMIIACIVIIVELVLREAGVYLAALFIPIGFATMVYPATVRWARRALELLIAMIFMKLFLVGGLLLGMSAIMESGAANVQAVAGTSQEEQVAGDALTVIIAGTAMFFFAAFAANKMMSPLPANMHTEGRISNPNTFFAAGDQLQTRAQMLSYAYYRSMNRIQGAQKIQQGSKKPTTSTSDGARKPNGPNSGVGNGGPTQNNSGASSGGGSSKGGKGSTLKRPTDHMDLPPAPAIDPHDIARTQREQARGSAGGRGASASAADGGEASSSEDEGTTAAAPVPAARRRRPRRRRPVGRARKSNARSRSQRRAATTHRPSRTRVSAPVARTARSTPSPRPAPTRTNLTTPVLPNRPVGGSIDPRRGTGSGAT